MQYILEAPTLLNTTVNLPASKSVSNRALIIHALAGGAEQLKNLSDCDDTDVIVQAMREMPYEINIKAAGTAMRFMTAYLAATPGEHVLTGTERMKHRPIGILVDALRRLGAQIDYVGEEGFPPLRIAGERLMGGTLEIAGNVSSQYISALLMVAPVFQKGLELHLTGDVISRPYIDLTLWMMREYGAQADWTGNNTITVTPQPYRQRGYLIENDWSAASYWYEMLALLDQPEAEVRLEGLMDGWKQGDSVVKYIFSLLGVKTTFASQEEGKPTSVTLHCTHHHVPRLDYDFVNSPDLAQTFVVSCALMDIPFHFTGLSTLKIKETDRIEALKTEMRKLGYVIEARNDCELLWNGERCETVAQPVIDTYEDHRMALAFAPAAIKIPGLTINHPEVVTKSYPAFWEHLREAQFTIQENETR